MRIDAERLARLTPEQRRELDRLLVAGPIWQPHPKNKPQRLAYESKADVIGYGGAAGGGKTSLAIGMALTKHRVVQFFRRESTEMGGIIDDTAKIKGDRVGLTTKPYIWRNPTKTCQIIEFCSVPHAGDETSYQGRGKDFIVFDEAANFLESQVRFLMGWMRSTEGIQSQALLTFNPPTTAEGRWIIAFFAPWLDRRHPNPARQGELRWFARNREGKEIEVPDRRPFVWSENGEERLYGYPADTKEELVIIPKSRTFIAARVTDNPYFEGSGYVGTLQQLPEPLRSQMLFGDFSAGMEDDPFQVIPTGWVEAAMARWKRPDRLERMDSIGVDVAMGGKDQTVIARRHGDWFDAPVVYEGKQCKDGATIAGYVFATASAGGSGAPIHVDLFGVGAEPYGHLMQMGQHVFGVNVGDKASGTDKSGRLTFDNMRSMLWWRMREALDPTNGRQIALPQDQRLLADLCAPCWERHGNRICVEERKAIVTKLGRSPDYASAYLLALMDTPRRDVGDELARGQRKDWNPFDLAGRRKR